jgi:hypothetical protein
MGLSPKRKGYQAAKKAQVAAKKAEQAKKPEVPKKAAPAEPKEPKEPEEPKEPKEPEEPKEPKEPTMTLRKRTASGEAAPEGGKAAPEPSKKDAPEPPTKYAKKAKAAPVSCFPLYEEKNINFYPLYDPGFELLTKNLQQACLWLKADPGTEKKISLEDFDKKKEEMNYTNLFLLDKSFHGSIAYVKFAEKGEEPYMAAVIIYYVQNPWAKAYTDVVRFCLDQKERTNKVGVMFVTDGAAEVVEADDLYITDLKVQKDL